MVALVASSWRARAYAIVTSGFSVTFDQFRTIRSPSTMSWANALSARARRSAEHQDLLGECRSSTSSCDSWMTCRRCSPQWAVAPTCRTSTAPARRTWRATRRAGPARSGGAAAGAVAAGHLHSRPSARIRNQTGPADRGDQGEAARLPVMARPVGTRHIGELWGYPCRRREPIKRALANRRCAIAA